MPLPLRDDAPAYVVAQNFTYASVNEELVHFEYDVEDRALRVKPDGIVDRHGVYVVTRPGRPIWSP